MGISHIIIGFIIWHLWTRMNRFEGMFDIRAKIDVREWKDENVTIQSYGVPLSNDDARLVIDEMENRKTSLF